MDKDMEKDNKKCSLCDGTGKIMYTCYLGAVYAECTNCLAKIKEEKGKELNGV